MSCYITYIIVYCSFYCSNIHLGHVKYRLSTLVSPISVGVNLVGK